MAGGDLTGKLVLVTDGLNNIGNAITRRFTERGAQVITDFSRSADGSKHTATHLRPLGVQANVIRPPAAQKQDVDFMFDTIEAKYGRLDILVNDAAPDSVLGSDKIGTASFDQFPDTNLKGAFWCSCRAAALMARAGRGAIVNVLPVDATFKTALESLTRYLAVEYAPQHIRVNTTVATLMDRDVATVFADRENAKQSSLGTTPLCPLATVDDIADLVLFLASDAAGCITGQVVVADGGLSLPSEGLSPWQEWAARAPAVSLARPLVDKATALSSQQPTPSRATAELLDVDDISDMLTPQCVVGTQDFWRRLQDWTARVSSLIRLAVASQYGCLTSDDCLHEALTDFSNLMRQLPERRCDQSVARRPRVSRHPQRSLRS